MNDAFVSVVTRFRGRFRMVEPGALSKYCGIVGGAGSTALRDALAGQDSVARLLVEMDRKLDAILTHLQRETIMENFPHEGLVLELSGGGLVLESSYPLAQGDFMELLIIPDDYQQRPISVMAEVIPRSDWSGSSPSQDGEYAVTYTCISEEDREQIIQFVFQEERRQIRRRKGELESI